MVKVQAKELRAQTKEQVSEQLNNFRAELSKLRVAQITSQGGASKLSQIKSVRKNIARTLTVITQKQREALRVAYDGKKYKPISIRDKSTRAQRRALSAEDKARMTLKDKKKLRHFPKLKIALKA